MLSFRSLVLVSVVVALAAALYLGANADDRRRTASLSAAVPNPRTTGSPAVKSSGPDASMLAAVFDILDGFIPDGAVLTSRSNATVTLLEAARLCHADPECAGFTTSVPEDEVSDDTTRSLAELSARLGVRAFHFKTASMARVALGPWLSFVRKDWTPRMRSVPLAESPYRVALSVEQILELAATSYNANYRGPALPDVPVNASLVGKFNVTVLHRRPWVLQVDGFVSRAEAEYVASLPAFDFKPSGLVAEHSGPPDARRSGLFKETYSAYRTSWTAHCGDGACQDDPVVTALDERMAAFTSTHRYNAEPLQLTRYDVGQEFKVHSDMIPAHGRSPAGHRILTVFGYLQAPDAGGATTFPTLGLSVEPVVGRVVIWSNAADEEANREEPLTYHAGAPVLAGRKIGFNRWIHRGDYKTAALDGLG